jgi:hypothetical protein
VACCHCRAVLQHEEPHVVGIQLWIRLLRWTGDVQRKLQKCSQR